MSVKKDPDGRRWVQVEVEVPGTPEQVWEAIATGPGVSSWFIPTEVDGREGGTVTCHFGPGMDSVATITAWAPPHRFAAESPGMVPGGPPLATEWIVEAREGGTSIVRVVHSLFASTDDWDDQLESVEAGWPTFFRILRLYLEHFRGEPRAYVSVSGMAAGDEPGAWATLAGALGLEGARAGERRRAAEPGGPPLAGTVEQVSEMAHGHSLLLRLDEPAPGVAMVGVHDCGGPALASMSLYLFGDRAAEAAARDEPRWRALMESLFPAADAASTAP